MESKFHKENASILAWITKTNQKMEHEHLRQRLEIDNMYKECGKWFFESPQFGDWKDARDTNKPILWLRGTGMAPCCNYYYTLVFSRTLTSISWNWKDNIDVRDFFSTYRVIA